MCRYFNCGSHLTVPSPRLIIQLMHAGTYLLTEYLPSTQKSYRITRSISSIACRVRYQTMVRQSLKRADSPDYCMGNQIQLQPIASVCLAKENVA
ncbi:hypothetical protein LZ554_008574 [Drepanopeziza brunnea f. sp. 'monogermtubi']|nr:hypothetical protein LZ554_008574 [Drepanopeziza brunnea f. sp. 'monogermtubi']